MRNEYVFAVTKSPRMLKKCQFILLLSLRILLLRLLRIHVYIQRKLKTSDLKSSLDSYARKKYPPAYRFAYTF